MVSGPRIDVVSALAERQPAGDFRLGRLHVNEDWVILELVGRGLRAVSGDDFSDSVLLTNLANLVQPLLRYQLTDRIRFIAMPCACGDRFPANEVEGRSDDTPHLRSERGAFIPVLPLALEKRHRRGRRRHGLPAAVPPW